MFFVLLLTTAQFVHTDTIETTSPVSIVFDGFTLESWSKQLIWNKTRTSIVYHLNGFCKNDIHCDAEYGIDNIHLLNVIQCGLSSICLNITADKPILNKTASIALYNYTALLTGALFQAKIDVEHAHDNQLFSTIVYSSTTHSHQNSIINRTNRLLFVLLGIVLVAIIFALTLFFFQRIRQHRYSKLFKSTQTCQQTNDELLNNFPSTSILHS